MIDISTLKVYGNDQSAKDHMKDNLVVYGVFYALISFVLVLTRPRFDVEYLSIEMKILMLAGAFLIGVIVYLIADRKRFTPQLENYLARNPKPVKVNYAYHYYQIASYLHRTPPDIHSFYESK